MFKIYNVKSNILEDEPRGSKRKFWTKLNNRDFLIKWNSYDINGLEIRSWNVSEKLYSEIAKKLNINVVDIDFVRCEKKNALASYSFINENSNIDKNDILSGDNLYINAKLDVPRKTGKNNNNIDLNDYTYFKIFEMLCKYDKSYSLLKEFHSMMIMDALVGESDRHYENWGIFKENNTYHLLPIYDNSSCLLYEFRQKKKLDKESPSFYEFADKATSKITLYGEKINHFKLIDLLYNAMPIKSIKEDIKQKIIKLKCINEEFLDKLLNNIPESLCTSEHKEYIKKYIMYRRDKLISIVGDKDD